MMTEHYQRVRTFMQKAGQEVPEDICIPDPETRLLRAKLIIEEALETVEALGVQICTNRGEKVTGDTIEFSRTGEPDLEQVADGCADLSVVTMGTLVAFGIQDDALLREVDASNLRKFSDGGYEREDGKWMKPPDWTPPDIAGVLSRQERGRG